MKTTRFQKISSVLALCFLASLILFSGCKFSKEEREKAESEKARRQTEAQQKALEAQEARRFEIATKDLDDRVRMYDAVSGHFQGRYTSPNGKTAEVDVRFSTANLPPRLNRARPVREADAVTQMEGLSLDVDLQEMLQGKRGKMVACSATGVKPDFARGMIRVVCNPQASGPSRVYVFGFDYDAQDFTYEEWGKGQEARSRLAAEDLTKDKIRSIDAMSFVMMGAEVNFKDGKLWRQDRPE